MSYPYEKTVQGPFSGQFFTMHEIDQEILEQIRSLWSKKYHLQEPQTLEDLRLLLDSLPQYCQDLVSDLQYVSLNIEHTQDNLNPTLLERSTQSVGHTSTSRCLAQALYPLLSCLHVINTSLYILMTVTESRTVSKAVTGLPLESPPTSSGAISISSSK